MKLLRFGEQGHEKPGVLLNGIRKDCSAYFTDWNHAFFQNNGLKNLADLLKTKGDALPNVSENERTASCIARPSMIMCIGLNYSDHAAEAGMEVPKEPLIFGKLANTICGAYDNVPIPKGSEKTDWEVELGIILGKDALYLNSEEEAEDHIAGYCVVNDLSERAFQLERGGQWIKGKSCPNFCPTGPYLVTKEEIQDVLNLPMRLSVNGVQKQNGNTKTMVFSPNHIVYYMSQFMKLGGINCDSR